MYIYEIKQDLSNLYGTYLANATVIAGDVTGALKLLDVEAKGLGVKVVRDRLTIDVIGLAKAAAWRGYKRGRVVSMTTGVDNDGIDFEDDSESENHYR